MKRSIIIIIAVCLYSFSFSQEEALSFHHLSKEDGLSNDINSYIYKDSRGYVWISSIDGLNRFDGQSVKVYRPDVNSDNAINGNIVSSNFYEDSDANIWFTTYGSVNCYIRTLDHFISFRLKNNDGIELTEDYRAFHLDEDDGLWVRTGLREGGLLHQFDINSFEDHIVGHIDGNRNYYLKDRSTNTSHIISTMFGEEAGLEIRQLEDGVVLDAEHYFRKDSPLPETTLLNIFATSLDEIYLGSPSGLVAFSSITGKYKTYESYKGNPVGLVWAIEELSKNYLLVSTQFLGLLVFDTNLSAFVNNYQADITEPFSLHSNRIHEIYVDRSNCIWVSSWGHGIDYACLGKNRFNLVPESHSANDVSAMLLDSSGDIWIADRSNGITIYNEDKSIDRKEDPLKKLGYDSKATLNYLYFDRSERVWGIVADHRTRSSQLIYKDPNNPGWKRSATTNKDITSILELDSGRVLISTKSGVLELLGDRLVPCREFTDFHELPFYKMYKDNQGKLYLPVNFDRVLICKENEEGIIEIIKSIKETGNVKAIYESTADSLVWFVGSSGLIKMNKYTFETEVPESKVDGLNMESMFAITSDDDGDLWVKNQIEIQEYNVTEQTVRKYDVIDGVQNVANNSVELVKDTKGFVWMSGPKGVSYFHPDSIVDYNIQAQPQFTDIRINGEAIKLDTFIGESQSIVLTHDQNTISLEFVSNAFSDPSKSQFRYRLLDYDPLWVSGETQGVARFVNVPWGDYQFELQATNSDGIWSPTKMLKISIEPPWGATWWAYLLYLLGAVLLLQVYTQYRSRVLISQNVKLEETVSTRTAELAKSLSDLKKTQAQLIHSEKMASLGQVTAGIAHEIQNPLNFVNNFSDVSSDLIAEMVEEMDKGDLDEAKSIAADVQENMNRIAHHGRRADNIVSSMLEHSRASTGEVVPSDINSLVKENLRRTYNLINKKEQYFDTIIETNFEQTLSRINVVPQDIGRVVYNILTNALYASYEKKKVASTEYIPKVQVSTQKSDQWISILIKDNGIGIAKDNINKVFQPFYTTKPTGEGTGLGLSLSYDIIRAHGGELKVESVEGEGSTFIIQLPVKQ